jgi:hypothetical protein
MNTGRTIFSQLMFLPTHELNQCVVRYGGNRRVRQFSCRDQFLSMVFAQLTYRESDRTAADSEDIEKSFQKVCASAPSRFSPLQSFEN